MIEPRITKGSKRIILKWLAPLNTVLGAVYPLPQFVKIVQGTTTGVSMSAWIIMTITSLFWAVYCLENKQHKPGIDNAIKTFFRLLVVIALGVNWWHATN